jgi:hypothetical protein
LASKGTQSKKTTRKLTAILCADVHGYSPLMREGSAPMDFWRLHLGIVE